MVHADCAHFLQLRHWSHVSRDLLLAYVSQQMMHSVSASAEVEQLATGTGVDLGRLPMTFLFAKRHLISRFFSASRLYGENVSAALSVFRVPRFPLGTGGGGEL